MSCQLRDCLNSGRYYATYKAADVDIVCMDFTTGTALDFESVPEIVLWRVIRPQISHPSAISLVSRVHADSLPRQVSSKGKSQHLRSRYRS
jgi:hypothetical protein